MVQPVDSSKPSGDDTSKELVEAVEGDYLTLTDFCRFMKVGYRTGLAWIKTGKIKVVMVGGRYRIYESEIKRFLTEGNADRRGQ